MREKNEFETRDLNWDERVKNNDEGKMTKRKEARKKRC